LINKFKLKTVESEETSLDLIKKYAKNKNELIKRPNEKKPSIDNWNKKKPSCTRNN
jgi:hypothetical protein